MTSTFQPPADYPRREVEASTGPNCPFYGASLVGPFVASKRWDIAALARFGTSNRCALITSAHSPCWMEVEEGRAPDWSQCPRNPELVALNILGTDVVSGRQADVRMLASIRHLAISMLKRRAMGEAPTLPAQEIPE